MPETNRSGFEELPHTADWALRVWGTSYADLLESAARGMYSLLNIELKHADRYHKELHLFSLDRETILVTFLNELLFFLEESRVAFDKFEISTNESGIDALLEGDQVLSQSKEIKAVTYHNLQINESSGILETTIVFDV